MKNQKNQKLDFNPSFDSYNTLLDPFKDVVFIAKNHTYEIDGNKIPLSVTGLLSKYKKPFDSHNMSNIIARKDGVDQKDVLDKWDFARDYANHAGTEFHAYVENYLERRRLALDKESITKFFKFREDFKESDSIQKYYIKMAKMISGFHEWYEWYKEDHTLIKSELVIGDKECNLAGTLDNLSFNRKTNELVIFDYKTNKAINVVSKYKDRMLDPISHLDNCELNTYSLQIWLYKLMIERNTPYKLGDCHILWFNGDRCETFGILDLKKEASDLFDIQTSGHRS